MKRRELIKKISLGTLGATVCLPAKASATPSKIRLKMATTWPAQMPILQEAADRFAKSVKIASNGRLKIKVYAGNELVPPFGVFDAVSSGTIDMGYGSPYYWSGKIPAAQFFGSVPFGMSSQQFYAWMLSEGQKLWEEVYAPFNLIPFSFGNTGMQMAGWFKKPINSLKDLKGLKFRIPGLGGKVIAKTGANVVLMPGSEIYTALERGTIDATEWISPFHDERLGLHRAAAYYYYPGWQEPGSNLELTINKSKWDSIPKDMQAIIKVAASDTVNWTLARSEAENGPALSRIKNKYKVKVLPLPQDVLKALRTHTKETLRELSTSDPQAKKVFESYMKFKDSHLDWAKIVDSFNFGQ